jgi:hypothetical protein
LSSANELQSRVTESSAGKNMSTEAENIGEDTARTEVNFRVRHLAIALQLPVVKVKVK